MAWMGECEGRLNVTPHTLDLSLGGTHPLRQLNHHCLQALKVLHNPLDTVFALDKNVTLFLARPRVHMHSDARRLIKGGDDFRHGELRVQRFERDGAVVVANASQGLELGSIV
jgi:hypothetical protein